MSYLVGVDIGGTFTDCVVIDERGAVTTAKAPSTPDDFARGMIDAIEAAAERIGVVADALYPDIALLSHGTTVGTNAIVQKRGARIGLVTTKGHNDVIHIMRGSRGVQGRDVRLVVHFPESQKPEPIVPKRLIAGVSERVDCFGDVVVPLNEDGGRGGDPLPHRRRASRRSPSASCGPSFIPRTSGACATWRGRWRRGSSSPARPISCRNGASTSAPRRRP